MSSLTLRERRVLSDRYISGLTVAETADDMQVEIEALIKMQRRILHKLYDWLTNNVQEVVKVI